MQRTNMVYECGVQQTELLLSCVINEVLYKGNIEIMMKNQFSLQQNSTE